MRLPGRRAATPSQWPPEAEVKMPMLQYAEVDEKAWRPLEIQERLDAYYSFREARHEELKPLPKKADPFAHRELSFIPAESLGTLPETAHMTIAARRAFFNPKSREEIIADLEKRRLEAEARQAAREEAERLALREAEAAAEAEAARLEAEQDAADEAAGKKKKKKRKKKKKAAGGSRPASAAVERPKVAAAKRPLSAPAKIARALPIRTYATEFRGAVRGLPDAPTCDVKAAPGSRTGHRSAILSDKEVYAVKEPSVEDGPVDPDPTPRNADGTPREHRTVEFTGTLLMRLTSATPWANVRYTLDGSAVKRTSRIYRRPLELSNHCVVRCVTSKRGWSSGELIVRFVRMADKRGIKEKMLNAAKRGAALGLVDQRRISRGDAPDAVEDMDDTQLLLRAVLAQDVPSVREIVSGGAASPDGGGLGTPTPLVLACEKGATLVAQVLVGHKAAMQLPAEGMVTPLQAACGAGALACARLLIDAGCPPTGGAADEMGRVAIHRAAARGAAKCCEALLRAGAAVDAADKEGDQALHALCANVAGPAAGELPRGMEVPDYLACAKVLVDAGAPLEAKGAGKKPLALAALRAASATSTAQADLANALSELLLAAGAKPPPPPGEEEKGGGKKKK